MKRFVLTASAILLVSVLLVPMAFAAASGPPSNDSFVRSTDTEANFNGQGLSTYGSTAACTPTDWSYLQWDLTQVGSNTVDNAVLTLTTTAVNSVVAGSTKVALHKTASDWTETNLKTSSAPAVGDLIQEVNAPTSASGNPQVVFDAPGLAAYVDAAAQSADKKVSFVVKLSGTCNAVASRVGFADKENANSSWHPDLQLQNPNAVTLRTVEASGTSTTPLLFAGIALLLVAAGAGLIWARRNQVAS